MVTVLAKKHVVEIEAEPINVIEFMGAKVRSVNKVVTLLLNLDLLIESDLLGLGMPSTVLKEVGGWLRVRRGQGGGARRGNKEDRAPMANSDSG